MHLGRDPVARRRSAVLAVGACALAAGIVVGSGADEAPRTRTPAVATATRTATPAVPERALASARQLPLERRVGLLVIMRFAGHPAPPYVARALRAGRASGVILFKDNAPTRAATEAMIRSLQSAAGGDAIVCTDQEGGAIRTLLWAGPTSGQATAATPRAALELARTAARDLADVGVNVNLGPVADLDSPGTLMRGRAFPGGPVEVSAAVRAAVEGYRGIPVLPTIKHFPGLGAAEDNTDDAQVTLERSPAQLVVGELLPFQAAVDAGARLVMLSHAVYPALDADAIASQSPAVIELLRGRLGFDGVTMTDSIEAEAVTSRMGPGRAAVNSVRAGVDIVLTTGQGSHLRAVRALLREARRSPSFEARVTESAARVIELRSGLSD